MLGPGSRATIVATLALAALGGCGGDPNQNSMLATVPDAGSPYPTPTPGLPTANYPTGLHAVGNQIQDGDGQPIVLHGANRSGTEYKCVQSNQIFDGPSDEASVAAIASWNLNAVRVPLNESCWLAIGGVSAATSGANYQTAIVTYVALLHKYGLVPILDLHWAAPGTMLATREQPMPDADNSPSFWNSVATTFASDAGVVFEPYNEPYPDSNRDTVAGWTCWRDGCTANLSVPSGTAAMTYAAAGMQALVTAIRTGEAAAAPGGTAHLILLGGLEYSNALSQWLAYAPTDTAGNLGAAWHVYSNNACMAEACYDMAPAMVAAAVPVVATEIGESDCMGTFITPLMTWLDGHASGYLAWSWNAFGACVPASGTAHGSPWSLVANYDTAVPNSAFADTFYAHVTGL